MKAFITQCALNSHLNLKHDQMLPENNYRETFKSGALKITTYPEDLNKNILQNDYERTWPQEVLTGRFTPPPHKFGQNISLKSAAYKVSKAVFRFFV